MGDGNELTVEDIESAKYFLLEKGDITRWMHWEAKKPLFEREYPELIAAINNVTVAERTLRAVIKSIDP